MIKKYNMGSTIIVVEDDFIIALDVRGILEEAGFSVITNIATVEEAIARIELDKPDLVLIDINLKKNKDGINLGHYLLNKGGTPYIYLSGNTDNFTMDRVKETRPHGFIVKPFKKTDVTTAVALVLSSYDINKKVDDAIAEHKDVVGQVPYCLKDVMDYVEDNIGKKFTISELAERSRWKEQHFIRMFSYYIGETPYQYILKRKIDRAKKLIIETKITFSEISFELGFQSYGNFCNAFKRITGKTPNIFRKFHSKNPI
jgi:AraC-like DNA-binding protein/CheY-like chemotaxis protein